MSTNISFIIITPLNVQSAYRGISTMTHGPSFYKLILIH